MNEGDVWTDAFGNRWKVGICRGMRVPGRLMTLLMKVGGQLELGPIPCEMQEVFVTDVWIEMQEEEKSAMGLGT